MQFFNIPVDEQCYDLEEGALPSQHSQAWIACISELEATNCFFSVYCVTTQTNTSTKTRGALCIDRVVINNFQPNFIAR